MESVVLESHFGLGRGNSRAQQHSAAFVGIEDIVRIPSGLLVHELMAFFVKRIVYNFLDQRFFQFAIQGFELRAQEVKGSKSGCLLAIHLFLVAVRRILVRTLLTGFSGLILAQVKVLTLVYVEVDPDLLDSDFLHVADLSSSGFAEG